jgi:hypothetical protein
LLCSFDIYEEVEMAKARRSDRAKWLEIIQQYQSSGKNQIQFAEERGLNIWTFRNWLYKFRKDGSLKAKGRSRKKRPRFVEVRVAEKPLGPDQSCPVVVRTSGGVSVEFNHSPNAEYLAAVLSNLR